MDTKFTPGPWQSHGSHIYSPDKKIIAVVNNPGSKESDYPLVPNRDLMTAAPDLYEALKRLEKEWGSGTRKGRAIDLLPLYLVNQIKAAIAKAEGKK